VKGKLAPIIYVLMIVGGFGAALLLTTCS